MHAIIITDTLSRDKFNKLSANVFQTIVQYCIVYHALSRVNHGFAQIPTEIALLLRYEFTL